MNIVELLQGLSSAATSIVVCLIVFGIVVVLTAFTIHRFKEAERKSKGLSEADENYWKAKKEDAQTKELQDPSLSGRIPSGLIHKGFFLKLHA